jgi:hypothetical protein
MAGVFYTCDRCGRDINYGSKYVSIERNVERASHNILKDRDEVKIINSELLLMMCDTCGKEFGHDNLTKIISAIPVRKSFYNDN